MAKAPARSAVSPVRADVLAATPVAGREIPGALPRNVPRDALENVAGPRRDSAVQAWIAATPRLEAPRGQPAREAPRAGRLRSSPADRPHGRACCERPRANPGCGDRFPTG